MPWKNGVSAIPKQRDGRTVRTLHRATALGRQALALAKTRLREFTGEAMQDERTWHPVLHEFTCGDRLLLINGIGDR
jgi:hypothetical protein